MNRITESQLVLPALYLMSKTNDGFISTSDLITQLTNIMKPTGTDAEILDGRNDTHFSQKVRNLKSHDTLFKKKFATNVDNGFLITSIGAEYVETHKDAIDYLLNNEFNYEDVKEAFGNISVFSPVQPIEEIISEGRIVNRNVKTYERSSHLRMKAIEYFTNNNSISCDCCGFNFPTYYGQKYGIDCIEIHHIKPIFQYDGEDLDQLIENALKNLIPVCPNCHRVIHKKHIGSEDFTTFKTEMQLMHIQS